MSNFSIIEVPSKDMVQKIRHAFAGVPDDSPFDKHLLIWSHHDALLASFVSDLPKAFSYNDGIYHLQQPYIGDWDALLNSEKQLIGLSVLASNDQPIIGSSFLKRHQQIFFADGMLQIFLCSDSECEIECVQGIGTRLYLDSRGDYMFLFPKWHDWGEIAFPLKSADVPDMYDKDA